MCEIKKYEENKNKRKLYLFGWKKIIEELKERENLILTDFRS